MAAHKSLTIYRCDGCDVQCELHLANALIPDFKRWNELMGCLRADRIDNTGCWQLVSTEWKDQQ